MYIYIYIYIYIQYSYVKLYTHMIVYVMVSPLKAIFPGWIPVIQFYFLDAAHRSPLTKPASEEVLLSSQTSPTLFLTEINQPFPPLNHNFYPQTSSQQLPNHQSPECLLLGPGPLVQEPFNTALSKHPISRNLG